MSDIAKWALLVAGIILVAGLILELAPSSALADSINSVVEYTDDFLTLSLPFITFVKGVLNHFFPAMLLNVVISWSILKPFLIWSVELLFFVYRWIFK